MLALDPVGTPDVLHTLDKYLQEYDSSQEDFATIEDYLPYRIPNAGYRCVILIGSSKTFAYMIWAESAPILRVGRWTSA